MFHMSETKLQKIIFTIRFLRTVFTVFSFFFFNHQLKGLNKPSLQSGLWIIKSTLDMFVETHEVVKFVKCHIFFYLVSDGVVGVSISKTKTICLAG